MQAPKPALKTEQIENNSIENFINSNLNNIKMIPKYVIPFFLAEVYCRFLGSSLV